MNKLDKTDMAIIKILKEKKEANKQTLWIKSFSREGIEVFSRRLDGLKKRKVINIGKKMVSGMSQYAITLRENKNGR